MSRETCIQHRPHNRMAIVREDYFELTGDAVAAALLNYFEYRANSALASHPEPENITAVNIGKVSTAEFQVSLLGLSTDKQIRQRLAYLRSQCLIDCPGCKPGKASLYEVKIARIQQALNGSKPVEKFGQTTSVKQPRSNDLGQITEQPRSNNRANLGQITEQPRSNDRASIYKNLEDQEKNLEHSLSPQDQGGEARSQKSLRSEDSEPVAQNLSLPVKTATADRLTGQGGVNVPPPPALPVHDIFARRGVPHVVPIQAQFSGPWGQGYTDELKRFESWLLEHKAQGKSDPSAWMAAVVDRMAKGGSRALWTEFERYESGAVEVPEQKQYSPAISKWLGL